MKMDRVRFMDFVTANRKSVNHPGQIPILSLLHCCCWVEQPPLDSDSEPSEEDCANIAGV